MTADYIHRRDMLQVFDVRGLEIIFFVKLHAIKWNPQKDLELLAN